MTTQGTTPPHTRAAILRATRRLRDARDKEESLDRERREAWGAVRAAQRLDLAVIRSGEYADVLEAQMEDDDCGLDVLAFAEHVRERLLVGDEDKHERAALQAIWDVLYQLNRIIEQPPLRWPKADS